LTEYEGPKSSDVVSEVDLSYDGITKEGYIEYIKEEFDFDESDLERFPFVYVLECHGATKEELKERHETFFGKLPDPRNDRNWDRFGNWIGPEPIPKWAWAATHYSLILYVGSTTDLLERLEEHCWGGTFRSDRCRTDEDGNLLGVDDPTKFTKYFPPKDIWSLKKVNDDLDAVREVERNLARKLRNKTFERYGNDVFVFSR